ncbi:MAG: DNA repair protein [Alphaproteobacteria bacterium]|nr:DNA repair protein [Alphaproteobacteria bacterium]MBV9694894.1 DNA repair protein [Alphaproteobacteria bacterium]
MTANIALKHLETVLNPRRRAEETPVPLGHAGADAVLGGGLKRAALHEVFAPAGHESAATGFAACLAARLAANRSMLWIRQDYCALEFGELAATGLLELGLAPARVLVMRAAQAEDGLRAALEALRCRALGAVVIELCGNPKDLDLTASRRLTLAAEENGVAALMLRFTARIEPGSAQTRWRVRAAPSPDEEENWGQPRIEAELLRNRQGGTGCWVMEWSCDDGIFRDPATDRGAVVSAAGDRPAPAALAKERRTAAA